jgi:hypothetical protein
MDVDVDVQYCRFEHECEYEHVLYMSMNMKGT